MARDVFCRTSTKEIQFRVNLALQYCSTSGTLWYVDFGFADSFPFSADDCTA